MSNANGVTRKETVLSAALIGIILSIVGSSSAITWRIATMNQQIVGHDTEDAHKGAKKWIAAQNKTVNGHSLKIQRVEDELVDVAGEVHEVTNELKEFRKRQEYNFTRLLNLLSKNPLYQQPQRRKFPESPSFNGENP